MIKHAVQNLTDLTVREIIQCVRHIADVDVQRFKLCVDDLCRTFVGMDHAEHRLLVVIVNAAALDKELCLARNIVRSVASQNLIIARFAVPALILAGTSSRDIALCSSVEVKCVNPYGLTPFTPIAKLVTDPAAIAILKKHIPGCDPVADSSFMIVFQPQVPFCDAWRMTFATNLSGSEQEKKAVYDAICADFDRANRTAG